MFTSSAILILVALYFCIVFYLAWTARREGRESFKVLSAQKQEMWMVLKEAMNKLHTHEGFLMRTSYNLSLAKLMCAQSKITRAIVREFQAKFQPFICDGIVYTQAS